ncbi:MAG: 4'-phosphopantetheinyl transferase superfamily protein [Nannocystaceae bacterium]|nr:4'-phosphopantetheinyl transferase superfamily protein [Nannocystaceae bacterium]
MTPEVGLDVVGLPRFAALLARNPEFATHYFTAAEQSRCHAQPRPTDAFATVFAVKEALLKALGLGVLDGVALADIDVELGRGDARIQLHGGAAARLGPRTALASWCRDGLRAWAVVVVAV